MEVFLGGTCNESTWRDELIPLLRVKYFNPVVKDWNEEAQELEIEKRESCDIVLYVITPKMTGVYSIAEATFDACTRPEKTVFCVLDKDGDLEFDKHQLKSLTATKKLIEKTGATVLDSLNDIAVYLNTSAEV